MYKKNFYFLPKQNNKIIENFDTNNDYINFTDIVTAFIDVDITPKAVIKNDIDQFITPWDNSVNEFCLCNKKELIKTLGVSTTPAASKTVVEDDIDDTIGENHLSSDLKYDKILIRIERIDYKFNYQSIQEIRPHLSLSNHKNTIPVYTTFMVGFLFQNNKNKLVSGDFSIKSSILDKQEDETDTELIQRKDTLKGEISNFKNKLNQPGFTYYFVEVGNQTGSNYDKFQEQFIFSLEESKPSVVIISNISIDSNLESNIKIKCPSVLLIFINCNIPNIKLIVE
jgi:hypothetical protein